MQYSKRSSVKWCKACGSLLVQTALSCFNCGSSTSLVSGFTHRHRSLITAIGGLAGLIGLGFVVFNLIMTREALELERQKFIEEFQPKISIRYLSVEIIRSGIDVNFGVMNTGKGIAYDLIEEVSVVAINYDTIKVDTSFFDRMLNSSKTQSKRIVRIERNPLSGFPIILTWQIGYRWQGEPTYVYYKAVFEITWDSVIDDLVISKTVG